MDGVDGNERVARRDELLGQIAHTGDLSETNVTIPGTGIALRVTRPTNTDLLLDQIADDPEQNLPYWAEIWPSGVALGAAVAAHPELVTGARVLELGSGIGITAALALAAGADVIATDYAPESLVLTRLTCLDHAGREPETLQVNWRNPAHQECLAQHGPYPVVLAADVLYEARDIEPLLELANRIVTPGGLLWLAHPGRPPARAFLERAREMGWRGTATEYTGPWPDSDDAHVIVFVHALRRPGPDR